MQMSDIGKEMLALQEDLAEAYGYKPIPPLIAGEYRQKYKDTLPEYFTERMDGGLCPVYTLDGTLIANAFTRIVIGDYGAFVEIDAKDVVRKNIRVKEGQEYRYLDPQYAERVKYLWFTAKDNTNCKIYVQKRTVPYADYRPGYLYISPFECYIKL